MCAVTDSRRAAAAALWPHLRCRWAGGRASGRAGGRVLKGMRGAGCRVLTGWRRWRRLRGGRAAPWRPPRCRCQRRACTGSEEWTVHGQTLTPGWVTAGRAGDADRAIHWQGWPSTAVGVGALGSHQAGTERCHRWQVGGAPSQADQDGLQAAAGGGQQYEEPGGGEGQGHSGGGGNWQIGKGQRQQQHVCQRCSDHKRCVWQAGRLAGRLTLQWVLAMISLICVRAPCK